MGPAAAFAPVRPLTAPDEAACQAAQAGRVARRDLVEAKRALGDISSVRGIFAADGYRDCEDYVIPELHHPAVLLLKNRLSGRIRKAKAVVSAAEAAVARAEADLAAAVKAGGNPQSGTPAWITFDPDAERRAQEARALALQYVVDGYPDGSAEHTAAEAAVEQGFEGTPEDLADVVAGVCDRTDLPPGPVDAAAQELAAHRVRAERLSRDAAGFSEPLRTVALSLIDDGFYGSAQDLHDVAVAVLSPPGLWYPQD